MDISAIEALTTKVLGASFFLSLVFGAIAQRTHFCTMGALSDIVHIGDWARMRMWTLAIAVAMLGFFAMVWLGTIDPAKTLYAGTRWRWLSALVGGALFGFGMVLASGCGSKTLVRIGGGSLKSLVVFLVMGIAAFATLKGVTAVLRAAALDPVAVGVATPGDLPALLSGSLDLGYRTAAAGVAIVLGGCLLLWSVASRDFIRFDNLLAGLGIGLVIVAMWWVTGALGVVPEHPDTLQEAVLATNSGRMEALSFVAPAAYGLDWLIFFSDKSKVLTVGVVSVAGVVMGSAAVALASGSFRWEGFGGIEDLANHMAGAVLMGVGGVTAMGCSIGQGISGLSTLNLMSFVAVAAIVAGALAAFRYQGWRVARML
ncbi:MAG: YeeE/YedE family protein [Pseudomonadota bacterium]